MSESSVLVVPNSALPQESSRRPGHDLLSLCIDLHTQAVFMPRAQAEEDPNWRQLIPYGYIVHNDDILVYHRKGDHTEQRLKDKAAIGFGGHIEPMDVGAPLECSPGSLQWLILVGLQRELAEEALLPYSDNEFVGLIIDDGSMVNRVHAGLVFRVNLTHSRRDHIGQGGESKRIEWMSLEKLRWELQQSPREMAARRMDWEEWTRIAMSRGMVF